MAVDDYRLQEMITFTSNWAIIWSCYHQGKGQAFKLELILKHKHDNIHWILMSRWMNSYGLSINNNLAITIISWINSVQHCSSPSYILNKWNNLQKQPLKEVKWLIHDSNHDVFFVLYFIHWTAINVAWQSTTIGCRKW